MALEQSGLDGQVAIVTGAGKGVGEGGIDSNNSPLPIPDY